MAWGREGRSHPSAKLPIAMSPGHWRFSRRGGCRGWCEERKEIVLEDIVVKFEKPNMWLSEYMKKKIENHSSITPKCLIASKRFLLSIQNIYP
jgi:hypothetical protein